MLVIRVAPDDWGDARPVDIERLLEDVASHINRELRNPVTGTINVRIAPPTDDTPRHLIQYYRPGLSTVQITASDKYWARYTYEFAHEFCHVMIKPSQSSSGPNHWFLEAVCEMASVFTLQRMSERWMTHPPYENWSSYHSSLAKYADDRLTAPEHALPVGISLSEWFAEHEVDLRSDPYMRDSNAVVSYQLLPIFEAHPTAWNTVQCLPAGHTARDSPTRDYLRSWHAAVDPRDEYVVDQVMQLFGGLL